MFDFSFGGGVGEGVGVVFSGEIGGHMKVYYLTIISMNIVKLAKYIILQHAQSETKSSPPLPYESAEYYSPSGGSQPNSSCKFRKEITSLTP